MRHFGAQVLRFLAILAIALVCSKCAGQGPSGGGVGTGQPASVQGRAPDALNSTTKANRADQILDLRVEESPEVTLVKITGDASLQDYEFRRSGEKGFVLEMNNINPGGALRLLPLSSDYLTLSGGTASPKGLQLVGTLRKPLDYYAIDTVGNDLVLALHLLKEARAASGSPPPSGPLVPDASGISSLRKLPRAEPASAAQSSYGAASLEPGKLTKSGRPAQGGPAPRWSVPGARMQQEISQKQYSGKPISLDLMDADLKNVLRLLSDITGTNMVLEPDVAGRVTIKVEKVPWDQVLDMVLAMNELGREEVGNVIRIARLTKLENEWKQQKEQIKLKQELQEASTLIGAISTAYLTVNYAQPADIKDKILEIKSEKGKVSVDERTSLIIYTDYPQFIETARNLLSRLDRATPQVMIEARIVTATREVTRALGTDWHLRFQKVSGISTAGTRDFQVNFPTDPLLGFTIADVIGDTLASIDFKLSALETASKVNIVAAPKVLTINNVKAVISQGQQIPYLQRSDYGSSSTQFKDAVVELQVTPHITPDQKVRLEIQAKQDEPTVKNYTVGDSEVPGIETRKVTTELLVDDGKLVVIGGVMRGREEEADKGTPGLQDVPVLGWLFKNVTKSTQKSELLIFISPQIVDPTGVRPRS
jgi:type IV pilus assembly protein PilQ